MDRLIEATDNTQNPSVVGLDPTEALVPPQVVASFADNDVLSNVFRGVGKGSLASFPRLRTPRPA